uniref:Transmembrane protein n=1 Tax=Medicago truncatula TaxID=3880 RepID=B7FFJ2_MEDTR|nr:unknown [Medicago truncatula]
MLKELILVMLGTFWWIKQVVLATMLMVIMEGSICCLLLLTLKPRFVLRWYEETKQKSVNVTSLRGST